MDDSDVTHFKLAKFARYLRRISVATRVVGIIIVICGVLTMLFAIPQVFSGRHEEEALALMLVALGVGGIGVLIWGTGVFHGAMAQALVVFGWIDGKLWEMMKALKERPSPALAPPPAATAIADALAAQVFASGPVQVVPAGPPTPESPAEARVAEVSAPEGAAQGPVAGGVEAPAPEGQAAPEPEPVIEPPQQMKSCKHCGAQIPAIVLRCKYCLERV